MGNDAIWAEPLAGDEGGVNVSPNPCLVGGFGGKQHTKPHRVAVARGRGVVRRDRARRLVLEVAAQRRGDRGPGDALIGADDHVEHRGVNECLAHAASMAGNEPGAWDRALRGTPLDSRGQHAVPPASQWPLRRLRPSMPGLVIYTAGNGAGVRRHRRGAELAAHTGGRCWWPTSMTVTVRRFRAAPRTGWRGAAESAAAYESPFGWETDLSVVIPAAVAWAAATGHDADAAMLEDVFTAEADGLIVSRVPGPVAAAR